MKRITVEISDKLHAELIEEAKKQGKLRLNFFTEVIVAGITYIKYRQKNESSDSQKS